MAARLRREGKRFPGPWALDAAGRPTDDPAALFADPPGTLLPVGGTDHGHKGYGLALMVEALTQGLGGFGRAEAPTRWGASVFVQVIDPAAFGGADAFRRADGLARGRVPRHARRCRAWTRCACRASAASRSSGGRSPRVSPLYPGIMDGAGAARREVRRDTAAPDRVKWSGVYSARSASGAAPPRVGTRPFRVRPNRSRSERSTAARPLLSNQLLDRPRAGVHDADRPADVRQVLLRRVDAQRLADGRQEVGHRRPAGPRPSCRPCSSCRRPGRP